MACRLGSAKTWNAVSAVTALVYRYSYIAVKAFSETGWEDHEGTTPVNRPSVVAPLATTRAQ
jgi:hypothetical protein